MKTMGRGKGLGRVAVTLGLCVAPFAGCERKDNSISAAASTQMASPQAPPSIFSENVPTAHTSDPTVLIAGGDVDLSRTTGQRILRDGSLDLFREIRPLLATADIRFANLESQLCDLKGKTVSEHNHLVFSGPPGGAEVVKRGGFDILSTANNHAWDFGLRCLTETIKNLERVGIRYVGTDAAGEDPLRPVVIDNAGQIFAFFALTAIFNAGRLREHEAKAYVADADIGVLAKRIRKIRKQVERVVVSVHIGEEYMDVPIEATRRVLIASARAGADLVLGHHTHTPQRVEFHRGVPVVMSMGNLVFRQHRDYPWTGWGYLSRVTFPHQGKIGLEVCPYHLLDASPRPLTSQQQEVFWTHWNQISKAPQAGKLGARSDDGCVQLRPPDD